MKKAYRNVATAMDWIARALLTVWVVRYIMADYFYENPTVASVLNWMDSIRYTAKISLVIAVLSVVVILLLNLVVPRLVARLEKKSQDVV